MADEKDDQAGKMDRVEGAGGGGGRGRLAAGDGTTAGRREPDSSGNRRLKVDCESHPDEASLSDSWEASPQVYEGLRHRVAVDGAALMASASSEVSVPSTEPGAFDLCITQAWLPHRPAGARSRRRGVTP